MIFSLQDRQKTFEDILSITRQCSKIVSLVQVGSGAKGYHDDRSDLDFVIALDSDDSMTEVMEYMHRRISDKYELLFLNKINPGISSVTYYQIFWKLISDMARMIMRQLGNRRLRFCMIIPVQWKKR